MLAPAPRAAEQSAAESVLAESAETELPAAEIAVPSALDEPTWTQMLVPPPRPVAAPSPAEQPAVAEPTDEQADELTDADPKTDAETDVESGEPAGVEAKSETGEWIPEQRVGEAEPSAQEPSAVSPTHPEVEHGEEIAEPAEHWDSLEPIQLELALLLDSQPMPDPDVFYERTIYIPHPRQPSS